MHIHREIWTDRKKAMLCDLLADDKPFRVIAREMGMSHNAVAGKIKRIRDAYGWQGR